MAQFAIQKSNHNPKFQQKAYEEAICQWQKGLDSGELAEMAAQKTKEQIEYYKNLLVESTDLGSQSKYATPVDKLKHSWEDIIMDASTKDKIWFDIVFYLKNFQKLDLGRKVSNNLWLLYGPSGTGILGSNILFLQVLLKLKIIISYRKIQLG